MRPLLLTLLILLFPSVGSSQSLNQHCPRDKSALLPSDHQMVLLDISETFTPQMQTLIKKVLRNYFKDLNKTDRISFFSFNTETAFTTMLPVASRCIEYDSDTTGVKALMSNPRFVAQSQRTLQRFVDKQVDTLTSETGSSDSPIAEAITALSKSSDVNLLSKSVTLILVTDLLQYSPSLNLYKTKLTTQNVGPLAITLAEKMEPEISEWKVRIIKLERKKDQEAQKPDLLEVFWREFFKAAGVKAAPDIQVVR